MEKKYIYTDGGCEPNPGLGCWAFVCCDPYVEVSGFFDSQTTNNRMEMLAVIKAIEWIIELKLTDQFVIRTDSQYVSKGFNDWMHSWNKKGWVRKDGNDFFEVKNTDLWKILYNYRKQVEVEWIKGHSGDDFNEIADSLVRKEYLKSFGGTMAH